MENAGFQIVVKGIPVGKPRHPLPGSACLHA